MKKNPILIGLTGSIGMGKTATARLFRQEGVPVFCADSIVRALLARGGAAEKKIARLFPDSLWRGRISRKKLGAIVFHDPRQKEKLEKILHPLVFAAREKWIKEPKNKKAKALVLDIPLLFETKQDRNVDSVVCVSAPRAVQTARVLKRKNMDKAKLAAILKSQWPDAEKRRHADFVVRTDKGLADARRQVQKILQIISGT